MLLRIVKAKGKEKMKEKKKHRSRGFSDFSDRKPAKIWNIS